jgi:transcriptional regulator GlxA family with amidase domain
MVDGVYDLFSEANNYLALCGRPALFRLQLVGASKHVTVKAGMFTACADALIGEVEETDLVIIPASFQADAQTTIDINRPLLPWIIQQHRKGAEVASLCIGAFLLAATGLLDGKRCSLNWMVGETFSAMFPEVHAVTDKIIVDEGCFYSSGGGYSYMNLILYLVEKFAGRAAAVHCAKVFQIDISRSSQADFIIFSGQKAHGDELVKQAQEYIEARYSSHVAVQELAALLCMGRRSLELRFKKATGNTVTEYLQRVKVEAAKRSFESGRKGVNEVMYEVGYADAKTFRTVFKRITGLSPVSYRARYNKEAAASLL